MDNGEKIAALSAEEAERARDAYRVILATLRGEQAPVGTDDGLERLVRLLGDMAGIAAGEMVARGMGQHLSEAEATAEAIASVSQKLDAIDLAMLSDGVVPPPPPLPEA